MDRSSDRKGVKERERGIRMVRRVFQDYSSVQIHGGEILDVTPV